MGTIETKVPAKKITLEAVVIRADGTKENLGVIAYYHKNPLFRLWYRIQQILGLKRK